MVEATARHATAMAGVICALASALVVGRLAGDLTPSAWFGAALHPSLGDAAQLVFHFATLPRIVVAALCGAGDGGIGRDLPTGARQSPGVADDARRVVRRAAGARGRDPGHAGDTGRCARSRWTGGRHRQHGCRLRRGVPPAFLDPGADPVGALRQPVLRRAGSAAQVVQPGLSRGRLPLGRRVAGAGGLVRRSAATAAPRHPRCRGGVAAAAASGSGPVG